MQVVKFIIFVKFSKVQFNSDNLIIAQSNFFFFFFFFLTDRICWHWKIVWKSVQILIQA